MQHMESGMWIVVEAFNIRYLLNSLIILKDKI